MFNVKVKTINASLKFLINVPTQKAKFLQKSLHKSDIPNQFQKLFKSVLWYCYNIKLLKFFSTIFLFLHFFLFTWNMSLCLAFCSSHIWLDIRAWDVHLKTLRKHSNIWGTRRALGHLATRRTLFIYLFIYSLFNVDNTVKKHCLQTI